MNIKRHQSTARAAVRNISRATANAGRAANLAATSADVVARRIGGPASAIECSRMVFEKVLASQSAMWGVGAAMMDAGPRLFSAVSSGRGPFAVWETAMSVSVQATAAILDAQRAVMAPMWSAVRANHSRLAKNVR
jgi:hypothetical protein